MAQFDVFQNPVAAARRAYPWVGVLQSEFADASPERIVTPLVPREAYPRVPGRLTPVDTLGNSRIEILSAIDYLFFGVGGPA